MRDRLRPAIARTRRERRERHHLAARRAHDRPRDVLGRVAIALGLREDAVDPAEAVEVVHVVAAQVDLQRVEDVVTGRRASWPWCGRSSTAYCGTLARNVVTDAAQLARTRWPRRSPRCATARDPTRLPPATSCDLELEAAGRAEPADRRRIQGRRRRALEDRGELRRTCAKIASSDCSARRALVPRRERHEHEADVRLRRAGEDVEAAEARPVARRPGVASRIFSTCWRHRARCARATRRREAGPRR